MKDKSLVSLFSLLFIIASCSGLSSQSLVKSDDFYKKTSTARYDLVDKAGKFVVVRERGYASKGNRFYTKTSIYPENDDRTKLLEESFIISNPGSLAGKVKVLRPYASRYNIWFEGKKYSTEMRLNEKEKGLQVKLSSPEEQWNNTRMVTLPQGSGVFCFFAQLIECVRMTGFLHLATKNDAGVMNFHLIWEGYPYYGEQYLNIPDGPISTAQLNYDGVNRSGESRYTLTVGEQKIFYFVDKEYNFLKRFWVSQGLSQTRSLFQEKER